MLSNNQSPFLKIVYISINESSVRSFLDYDFLLVVRGSIRVHDGNQTFLLEENDIFLAVPGISYTIHGGGNNVILSIVMDYNFFLQGNSIRLGSYVCNSASDSSRNYAPLHQLLSHIAAIHYEKTDVLNLNLNSLAYHLLYYLNTYHYVDSRSQDQPEVEEKYRERMHELLGYLNQNYAFPITLQETASHMNLSAPYLSSFFKRHMKENFNTFVNKIRLEHAVDKLIYTEQSITSLAFDSGFSSMNAFNRLFRETYGTTPNKFRSEKRAQRLFEDKKSTDTVREFDEIMKQIPIITSEKISPVSLPKINFPYRTEIHVPDMQKKQEIVPVWNRLINLGSIVHLAKRDVQKQIDQVVEGCPFSYARIEHVLAEDIMFRNPKNGKYLYTSFDRALDSILLNQMTPYLDLSYPEEDDFPVNSDTSLDIDAYVDIVRELLIHSINTYGSDDMTKWYFEIRPACNLGKGYPEDGHSFVQRFIRTFQLIKSVVPQAKVGGICHDIPCPHPAYSEIIEEIVDQQIYPDFLSIGIFPYEQLPENSSLDASIRQNHQDLFYTQNPSFALKKVREFKTLLLNVIGELPEIHVAYLAADHLYHYYLNDTCYQSSFFFHNTVDLIGEVDMLGYYQLSDIGTQKDTIFEFLDGRNGLFNKFGIKKPGAHLLELFSLAKNHLIQKGEDYVVLSGISDQHLIGLCNHTYLSDSARMAVSGGSISITDAYGIYESPNTKNISIHLCHMTPGNYDVIYYQLNQHNGSVLDEWERNEYWDRFSREELAYMRKTLQPKKTHMTRQCEDGTLNFQVQLSPHEVLFIALIYRM